MTRDFFDYINDVIHEYFGVDNEIVWEVCTKEIPPLKLPLKKMLKEVENR